MKAWKNAELVELNINETANGNNKFLWESKYTNADAENLGEVVEGGFEAAMEQLGDLIHGTTETIS